MMSHHVNPSVKPGATKDENQSSGGGGNRKTGSSRAPQDQQPAAQKCPRCDSPNTKFCYYNNYSLSQPRHFCKTCRRYWTKGGALRNVPIGGGCRKNKKMRSSSSRLSGDSKDPSSELGGGLKFFHGLSPAMDFQLGGLSFPRPPATGIYSQFASFGDNTTTSGSTGPCFNLDPSGTSTSLLGFNNYPLSSVTTCGLGGAIQEMGSLNVSSGLASSIESLSSINQDLHWKLQQQRLAMLFGGGSENQKENNNNNNTNTTVSSSVQVENQAQKLQPILFQNLEISKPEISPVAVGNQRKGMNNETATEWFFGNSYAAAAPVTPTPTTSSNGNGNDNNTSSNWNGVQTWNDLHHYSTLP